MILDMRSHEQGVNYNSCDKMSKQAENSIREAIKNIEKKKREKCNLAAIKKYLEYESSLLIDLELQLNEMVRHGRINKKGTYSLGLACKGATAVVVLEHGDENVMGECNVKHDNPESKNHTERIQILESKLASTTQPTCSSQPSPHPIDPLITRLETEVEFLKQEILMKNRQISKIQENYGNGHSLKDAGKVGCDIIAAHSNQGQVESGAPVGRGLTLSVASLSIKDTCLKFSLERQRIVAPPQGVDIFRIS